MSWLNSTVQTPAPVARPCGVTVNFASAAAFALALSTSTVGVVAIRKFEDTARLISAQSAAPYVVAKEGRADIKAVARIRELGTREDGWKGPGSLAASKTAIDDAETFARLLFAIEDVEMPIIGLAADGEVDFYWKNNSIVLDLGFFGDGTYSYFAEAADGRTSSGDDVSIGEELPNHLVDKLKKVA